MNHIQRKAVITAIISTSVFPALAQQDATLQIEELASTTAVARRALQAPNSTTATLYSLEPDALRSLGILDLTTALEQLPGVAISSSSQSGSIQGIRLRGLRPQDTQLRVDGVRFTRRLGNLDIFAGNSPMTGLAKVELLQGPQSALFGGGSSGGVVNLTTQRGYQGMKNSSSLEAGSFNSLSLENVQGGRWKKLSYYLSTKYETTDNDTYGDNSEAGGFDNDSVRINSALRLDYDVHEDLSIGFTSRISDSTYETPQYGGSHTESQFYLNSLYADYQITDSLRSKLTFSYLLENTEFSNFDVNYDQFGISSENAYQYSDTGSVNFGAEYENQDYSNNGSFNPINKKDHYTAAYLNHAYELENLTIDAGVRHENYQSFGSHTSWKTGVLYQLNEKNTQLRANIGTGFNTPTLIQLYSPGGIAGNPDLDPETSLGWDISITQKITDKHTSSLTFFETEIEDAIQLNSSFTSYTNTPGKSKASGITAAVNGELTDQVDYLVNYTWLDKSFAGQPEQQLNAQVVFKASDKLQFGLGAKYLDQRSYGGNNLSDALIVRAFSSYQLNDYIKLHGRIENLTDTEYSHVDFTSSFGPGDSPARRLGAFAGITVEW
ncbi:MAG: TonB-dependent receptor plug domain-containing protein [Akkermansiaceae bacterium]